MVNEAVVAAIARSPLFASLTAHEYEALAAQCGVRRFDRGGSIFHQGDQGDQLFIVGQGSVALTASTAEGGEVVFAVLYPPTSFGEMAVVDGGPRAASAIARQRSVLVTVPGAVFRTLLAEHPAMAMALMQAFSGLIRRLDDHAVDLVLMDLPGRVVKFLLGTAGVSHPELASAEPVPVNLRMTQTEMARLVGGSRQNVNRVIVSLEASGAIVRSGTRIVAVRPDLLVAAIADQSTSS
jgi:CRP/FNR family cyclic AMP-dependent transcriptional regulator